MWDRNIEVFEIFSTSWAIISYTFDITSLDDQYIAYEIISTERLGQKISDSTVIFDSMLLLKLLLFESYGLNTSS